MSAKQLSQIACSTLNIKRSLVTSWKRRVNNDKGNYPVMITFRSTWKLVKVNRKIPFQCHVKHYFRQAVSNLKRAISKSPCRPPDTLKFLLNLYSTFPPGFLGIFPFPIFHHNNPVTYVVRLRENDWPKSLRSPPQLWLDLNPGPPVLAQHLNH